MSTIKLVAVGDIFLGEHPYTLGHGVTSSCRRNGYDFVFEKLKPYTQSGDIVCGNLEGIIAECTDLERGIGSLIFRGDPECAAAMNAAGFNCLFLANNHTAQHGVDALDRTCRLLDESEIKWTGYSAGNPGSCSPVIFDEHGVRVGLLAYCDAQQYHLDQRILPLIDLHHIRDDLSQLKGRCDVMVVSLHWGEEFIDYPSPAQTVIAHEIIDAGAKLILGHHSHSMQGIEHYNGGVIFYSLGTFVKDLWRKELRESVVLMCEISREGVVGYQLVPIYINDSFQPEESSGPARAAFLERMDSLSKKLKLNLLVPRDEMQARYCYDASLLARRDKMDVLKYYLKNIFRYDKKLLLENVTLIIKRRLRRKNL